MSKFYVTTSIAYVNAPPHIGFALESLQADVLARYHKQKGDESFFLTGTDEHGAKIAKVADERGISPKQVVDENAIRFKELKGALNLSWDNFIRTSDQKIHWPVAQEMWRRLEKAGDLYRKSYEGLYCVGHEAFVTQKDLVPAVNGRNHSDQSIGVTLVCADHQKEPELIKEENWFFKLSKYTGEIESRIKNDELRIVPESRKNEILSLLKEGLEDVSFSRPSKDLPWGVPVPGDDTQTMYVWADALSNYISGYACPPAGGADCLKKWEQHPADVHVIGKDILRFHAAIWPGMLLSAGLPLPKAIYVHGHILSGGRKMSKSLGNVVDPFELVDKYSADSVRYYLLREIPSSADGDFSYEKFEERYNGDLANGLGNFAARVSTLADKLGELSGGLDGMVEQKIKELVGKANQKLGEFKLHESLSAIWELLHFGDQYLNENKPWDKSVSEGNKQQAIHNSVVILDNVASLLLPFLPETSAKISKAIRIEGGKIEVEKISNLFPRMEKIKT